MKYLPLIAIGVIIASMMDPGFVHTDAALRDLGLGQVLDTASACHHAFDSFCKEHNISIRINAYHYGEFGISKPTDPSTAVVADSATLQSAPAAATGATVVADSATPQGASATEAAVAIDNAPLQAVNGTEAAVVVNNTPLQSVPDTAAAVVVNNTSLQSVPSTEVASAPPTATHTGEVHSQVSSIVESSVVSDARNVSVDVVRAEGTINDQQRNVIDSVRASSNRQKTVILQDSTGSSFEYPASDREFRKEISRIMRKSEDEPWSRQEKIVLYHVYGIRTGTMHTPPSELDERLVREFGTFTGRNAPGRRV
jgi:hypothetical protein